MPLPCTSALREQVIKELDALPTLAHPEPALVFAAVTTLIIAVAAAWYAITRPVNLRRYDPDEYEPRYRGIRRGLLVVAVLAVAEPLHVLLTARCRLFLLSSEMWGLLVDYRWPIGTEWGARMLLWYVTFPVARFVFAAALPVALFLGRRSFRTIGLWYLWGVMLALIVEGFILTQVFGNLSEVVREQFRLQSQWLPIALLGSGYLLFSRRVHATGRR